MNPTLLSEAGDYCGQALDLAPQNAGLWNVDGVINKKLGLLEEAIASYEEGLGVDGIRPGTMIAILDNLAEAHWLSGDLESGEASLRRAIAVADDTDTPAWFAWQDLAALELAQADVAAVTSINRAFKSRREPNWRMFVTRARIHLTLDTVFDASLALRDAYAALESSDADPRVERVMALAHLRNGEYAAAADHAQRALSLGDVASYDHLIIAIANANLTEWKSANAAYDTAIEVWPRELEAKGYTVSTNRGMLWFDTLEGLTLLLKETESLLR